MLPLNAIFWGFILLFNIPIESLNKVNFITSIIGYVLIIYGCYNLKDKNKHFKNAAISYSTILGLSIITLFIQAKVSIPEMIESEKEIINMLKSAWPYMLIEVMLNIIILFGVYFICIGISKMYEDKDKDFWALRIKKVWKKFRNSVIASLILASMLIIFTLAIAFSLSGNLGATVIFFKLYTLIMIIVLITLIYIIINYIRIIIGIREAHKILEKDMEAVDQYGKKY
jgi:ABC-type Fe3+ transport system permease subunit